MENNEKGNKIPNDVSDISKKFRETLVEMKKVGEKAFGSLTDDVLDNITESFVSVTGFTGEEMVEELKKKSAEVQNKVQENLDDLPNLCSELKDSVVEKCNDVTDTIKEGLKEGVNIEMDFRENDFTRFTKSFDKILSFVDNGDVLTCTLCLAGIDKEAVNIKTEGEVLIVELDSENPKYENYIHSWTSRSKVLTYDFFDMSNYNLSNFGKENIVFGKGILEINIFKTDDIKTETNTIDF